MDELVIKSFGPFTIKDETAGTVRAVVNTLGVLDRDRDVILPGAIKSGTAVKMSAYGHDVVLDGAPPAGKGTVTVEGDNVVFDGQFFMATMRGREAFEVVKALGSDGEWSIGFSNVKTAEMTDEWKEKGARRLISSLDLREVSPVFVGSNPKTATLSVKAAGSLSDRIEAIHSAVWARNDGLPKPWYAREVFEDHIIVSEDFGRLLRVPYTMADDGAVTLGDPEEVEMVYQPVQKAGAEPVDTKTEEPDPEPPTPVAAKSAEQIEQEALAEVFAGFEAVTSLAGALDRRDAATVEAKRIADDLATKRAKEIEMQRQMAGEVARFEATRKRLGVA